MPSRRMDEADRLIESVDRLLPQTQCERCGFAGCRAYAEAIVHQDAPINRCPPGGEATRDALAQLLGRAPLPLDPGCGTPHPRQLAWIREDGCIGCTKCIQVCPTDAIVGGAKRMHTVIADECTGCELCVEACPVDCIDLVAMPEAQQDAAHADAARTRFFARKARLAREAETRAAEIARRKAALRAPLAMAHLDKDAVLAAIARGLAKRRNAP